MKQIGFAFLAILLVGLFLCTQATTAVAGSKTAVIVVDVQGDFTTWKNGSLACVETDSVYVQQAEEATRVLNREGYPIFGTQDWHPGDHISFYTNHSGKKPFEMIKINGRNQVLWPPHCVQGTENARVLVDNNLFLAIVKKGKNPKYDSYSGFQDDGGDKTEMDQVLKRNGVRKVVVYGIATDYCVLATAVDAADAGYDVMVIEDLCRFVAPKTSEAALKQMRAKGITVIKSFDLEKIRRF
jgi:nicotinamidase/pyrazinamidase